MGPTQETGPCDEPIEDIDCTLGSWRAWTQCSATCGIGTRSRERMVVTPKSGFGNPCDGPLQEVDDCKMPACAAQERDRSCLHIIYNVIDIYGPALVVPLPPRPGMVCGSYPPPPPVVVEGGFLTYYYFYLLT